jgi:hypothetical protein
MEDKPKLRPIVFDVAVLAYLGDYITMVEKGVHQLAYQEHTKMLEEKRKKKK